MDSRLNPFQDKMEKTLNNLEEEYAGIRAGRANPQLGTRTPPSASSPKSAIWAALPPLARSARTRSRSPRFLRRTSDHGLLNRRAVHFARRADLDGRFVFWTGSTSTFPCAEGEPVFRMDGRPCRRADCRMLEHGLRFPLEKETYGWAFMSSRHRTIGRASHPTSARRRPRSAA